MARLRKIKQAASPKEMKHSVSARFLFSGGLDFQRILEVLSAGRALREQQRRRVQIPE